MVRLSAAAARLEHPHVVPVYFNGQDGEHPQAVPVGAGGTGTAAKENPTSPASAPAVEAKGN